MADLTCNRQVETNQYSKKKGKKDIIGLVMTSTRLHCSRKQGGNPRFAKLSPLQPINLHTLQKHLERANSFARIVHILTFHKHNIQSHKLLHVPISTCLHRHEMYFSHAY